MSRRKIVISGTGCALGDFLYNGISFDKPEFKKYLSTRAGDGGLNPGKLVFIEELEKYSGLPYEKIIMEIIGNRPPDTFNIGGPSLVSLIHAAQLLNVNDYEVRFYGIAGKDETAEKIYEMLMKTPLKIENYHTTSSKATPFTLVLSDPNYDNGHGERTFINNIGAAWDFTPDYLDDSFFNSEIVCFGGTALVPQIHDNLTYLLAKAKRNNCFTLVNTVFDFRNEKNHPDKPWSLGNNDESFKLIDVLVMDQEEALKISYHNTIEEAAEFFIKSGVSSFIITNGAHNIHIWSGGSFFENQDLVQMPVSLKVIDDIKMDPDIVGDTTGCGDNFAGGIIASMAWQLKTKAKGKFKLTEALSWGVASGGFSCFTIGGTYLEKIPREKFKKVQKYQKDYLKKIGYQKTSYGQKKLIIFGAGKIGRSFIAQLFSRGGYEVVFIDISKQLIDEINSRRQYNVIFKSNERKETFLIENIRGIHTDDKKKIFNELATAEIAAVSVGLNGLPIVFPLIAQGLLERQKINNRCPLDIIIAENIRNGDLYFRKELEKYLSEDYPFDEMVGLVETSIGKMVPIIQKKHIQEDFLQVFAEPYNELILNKRAFKNPIPDIFGLAPKENIKAWVDRKLFIHNLGHSAAAYIGYFFNPNFIYVYEALAVPEVYRNVRAAMMQAADILLKKYPGEFSLKDLIYHIDDLLARFQNKSLGDTIFRVGRDLNRKLGPEDRFSGVIKYALAMNLPYYKILCALIYGCHFRAKDEDGKMYNEDLEFVNRYQDNIKLILISVCGFDETQNSQLIREAESIERWIINKIIKDHNLNSVD